MGKQEITGHIKTGLIVFFATLAVFYGIKSAENQIRYEAVKSSYEQAELTNAAVVAYKNNLIDMQQHDIDMMKLQREQQEQQAEVVAP